MILLLLLSFLAHARCPAPDGRLKQLQTNPSWDWFLETEDNTFQKASRSSAKVVDVDLFHFSSQEIQALKAQKKVVLCYFSAGSMEFHCPDCTTGQQKKFARRIMDACSSYRNDAGSRAFLEKSLVRTSMAPSLIPLLSKGAVGGKMRDWNECWLDFTKEDSSGSLALKAMRSFIDLAKAKGCDGVEFDNIDALVDKENISDSKIPNPSREKQLQYNFSLAAYAQQNCLLAGLKNGHEMAAAQCGKFDFAVAEFHDGSDYFSADTKSWQSCKLPIFAALYGKSCREIPGMSVSLFPSAKVDGAKQFCRTKKEESSESSLEAN